jgi:hypothetical protein
MPLLASFLLALIKFRLNTFRFQRTQCHRSQRLFELSQHLLSGIYTFGDEGERGKSVEREVLLLSS